MHSAVTRVVRSGWTPATVLYLLVVAILLRYATPPLDIAKYTAYLVYGIVLPGTLLWRALRSTPASGSRPFVEDLAGGTAVGYALELMVYLPARAIGVPLAVAFTPAIVIIVFLAVPSLRRHWSAAGTERAPLAWSWTLAGVLAIVFAASAVMYYRWHGLEWPWSAGSYVDTLYQLALASEAKNHVPPTSPYVLDTSLDYHWFVHAQLAASSWVTGIELQVLIYRLFALPMIAAFTVLVALCAKRISGQWWAGALAAVMTFLVSSLSPYQWSAGAFYDISLLEVNLWVSPTQVFAAVLFAAAVLLMIDRLRAESPARGDWVLIALLLAAVMGAKATFLPLLLAGLGLVVAGGLLLHRRLNRPALLIGAFTLVLFAFATYVMFGGGVAHALQYKPLQTVRMLGALRMTGLSGGYGSNLPIWLTLLITALLLVAWGVRTAGVVGLFTKRARFGDPAILLLTGISIAGIGLTLALRHPGISQTYFIRSVAPYLAVLSICGIAAMIPEDRRNWRTGRLLLGVAAGAGLLAWGVAWFDNPLAPSGGRKAVSIELIKPIAVLGVVVAVGIVALWFARRRIRALQGISIALILVAITGLGIAPTADRLYSFAQVTEEAWRIVPVVQPGERPMPSGGIEAARWLRDHSDVKDLVATNTHCRVELKGNCDNRHFWISGYSERRVLVEGWGYTPETFAESWAGKGPFFYLPYWDPQLLAVNDAAFQRPSKETVGALRDRYHVRWLVVDERYDPPAPGLDDVATLRFRKDDTAVYEIPSDDNR